MLKVKKDISCYSSTFLIYKKLSQITMTQEKEKKTENKFRRSYIRICHFLNAIIFYVSVRRQWLSVNTGIEPSKTQYFK